MRNKAQIGTLQAIIITLVVIGLVIGVGFLLLEEFKENVNNEIATTTEAITPTDAGIYVSNNYTTPGINCYNSFAVTDVVNETGDVINSGNYTYNPDTGLVQNLTSEFTEGTWNVTYSYQYGLDSCGGIVSTINATKKIPTWLSIIVILAIVGILLAIVFRVLPSAGGGISFGRGSSGTVAEI